MYIVAVSDEAVFVIDQHNAHERVLYEKYLEVDRKRSWPRKMLLIPVIMELPPSGVLSFEENRALFEDAGFLVEGMGGRSYALKEYPDVFKAEEAEEIFLGLLEAGRPGKNGREAREAPGDHGLQVGDQGRRGPPHGQDGIPRRGALQDLASPRSVPTAGPSWSRSTGRRSTRACAGSEVRVKPTLSIMIKSRFDPYLLF